ncbi:TetR/AcrR family transcriptional regulator [Amycolatopsis sp. FDAARGOS 1241]|uniref:TetR/AcrR family transcriptional regulator n=1 Tax=Amycolatopsis sp. FDAARGOS 1241 TaxID=2778070 RepID=UPI00194F1398|nr:TetR/AcrR family transcriptional regulator [Amycolatopsis sp. FDAARGOS 1241]QRP49517.1 TetR/AcrR family transcriptional regulator [Amycolatopsis sp. FDAARGOS 1241]
MTGSTTIPHREKLLREGMRQLYAHGFHGTTIDGILDGSGVPKGSFYHHFGSKEAFAKQVLARYMQFQLDQLGEWSGRADLATPALLSGYFRAMAERFIGSSHERACLAGKLSTELAAGHEAFRAQLAEDLGVWKGRIVELLRTGQRRRDVRGDQPAEVLADAVLALVQGAFVVALASRDDASLASVATALELLVAAG